MAWTELNSEWALPGARNKTKVDLVRPLSPEVRAVLPAKVEGCPFVFTTDGANPISGFAKFKLAFDKACGAMVWTLHDLCRTARSLMSRAGVPRTMPSGAWGTLSVASAVRMTDTNTSKKNASRSTGSRR
jgi:hypothetical protein